MFKAYSLIVFSFIYLSSCAKIKVKEPDTSDLKHPCSNDDLKCIRKVFNEKGWCPLRKQNQFKNGKLHVAELTIEMPYFNTTDVTKNNEWSGLQNGKVVEFYINKITGNTVFSVEYTDVHIVGDALLCYHQALQEDIQVQAVVTEQYKSIIITTIIPKGRNGFDNSKSYARINVLPEYDFGEGLEDITNYKIQELFADFNKYPDIAIQDLYLMRAPIMARFFIDYIICSGKQDRC